MLNISHNSIAGQFDTSPYASFGKVSNRKHRGVIRFLAILSVITLIALFLPWTQNIRADGKVTTLSPDQRPQTIHSVIAGRIESWSVREGDYVEAGDTILFLSEVKSEYFDPNLVPRIQQQMAAKQQAAGAYGEKALALSRQLIALQEARELKFRQAQNKLQQSILKLESDSMDLEAARISLRIAEEQYVRQQQLYDQGLKSKTDLEQRELKMQEARAKIISAENKVEASRAEVINARTELSAVRADYADKIAKAESERFTALSNQYDAESTVAKLENQITNYTIRNQFYYVVAPQNGYITQSLQQGIGETIKEGTAIVSIMPAEYDLASSVYVRPLDLPLLEVGQKVRMQFDGWPAIVFSGWPNASQGTFGGIIFAIDKFPDETGKFRVMVAPDPEEAEWPDALRVGGGVHAMMLLQDVPIWYELWRQVNGFPPDYYSNGTEEEKETKKRKPRYK